MSSLSCVNVLLFAQSKKLFQHNTGSQKCRSQRCLSDITLPNIIIYITPSPLLICFFFFFPPSEKITPSAVNSNIKIPMDSFCWRGYLNMADVEFGPCDPSCRQLGLHSRDDQTADAILTSDTFLLQS